MHLHSVFYEMWSNQVYSYLLTGISGIGTFSNLKSFTYIRKTFDTTNNLFNVLAKDSLATTICSGIFCTTNIIKLFNEDFLTSKLGCVAHFAGVYLPSTLGPVASLLISVRRFIQLKYPHAISHNSRAANVIVTVILAFMACLQMFFLLFDTLTESNQYLFIEVCQGHLDQPQVPPKVGLKSCLIAYQSSLKLCVLFPGYHSSHRNHDDNHLHHGLNHRSRRLGPSPCPSKQRHGFQCWGCHLKGG